MAESEANARLIAAAPDLLVAAQDALDLLDNEFALELCAEPERTGLRAAIAKAKGA